MAVFILDAMCSAEGGAIDIEVHVWFDDVGRRMQRACKRKDLLSLSYSSKTCTKLKRHLALFAVHSSGCKQQTMDEKECLL